MRYSSLLALLGNFLLLPAQAQNRSEGALKDMLPPVANDHIKNLFPDAIVIHVRNVRQDNRECYAVGVIQQGQVLDLYVSPDGRFVARIQPSFSLTAWQMRLSGQLVLILIPCAVAGWLIRRQVQLGLKVKPSVFTEWISAWLGSALCLAMILSQLASVPREKDAIVIFVLSVVWGAVLASFVEAVGLVLQSYRGYRIVHRSSAIMFALLGLFFFASTILVDMLRIERENQYNRALAMRPSND